MSDAVIFGSYELLDRIAEGGMAEVWRARSRGVAGFEKTVVIKRVLPALMQSSSFAELLVREAKIAALLNHPNIVQIFDLGEERGAYFIAMEYVQGRDLGAVMGLGDALVARGGLSLELKLWIISEVAKALDHAHRRRGEDGRPLNIVHRDVSPQNILLGNEGAVKVADFGIARADEQELGRGDDPKVLRGKYAYMSPEQAEGQPLDRRSDLFSLGIVLWELLTGERLFRAGSSAETLERVRAARVPALPPELGLPPELDGIVGRALARDRAERYGSAAALHADLDQLLFDAGANVGEADLADAMERLFPRGEVASPNKLSVDLMLRAHEDATAVGDPSRLDPTPVAESAEHTRALPTSRRIRSERRRVVVLCALEREGDAAAFEGVARSLGGLVLPPIDGVREAVFGHAHAGERAAEHAARAALELKRRLTLEGPRRVDPVPPMLIAAGTATVFEQDAVEPDEAFHGRMVGTLKARGSEIRAEEEMRTALARTFVFSEGDPPVLEGFRARTDRDALALRRRGPLCGRREELRLLTEALAGASVGRGAAFLVLGEPSSGKSRLLAEVRALAATQDVVMVQGRGNEADVDNTYGALADLFADLCGLEDDDPPEMRFEKVERLRVLGLSPAAVRRVGELLGLAYPMAPDRRQGRPRGLELMLAVRRAVATLARDRTVLLALEDVQWMDDPTRQLLPLLLRGLEGSRVVTVLTARPATALPHLDARVVSLEPLSGSDSGRLFAHTVGARAGEDELAERVLRETAGNPGWVGAMAEALLEAERVTVDGGVASVVGDEPAPLAPADVAAVTARLLCLRPGDRELLRLAALFEDRASVATLAELHGVPTDSLQLGVRRLVMHRLLVGEGPAGAGLRRAYPGSGSWGGGTDGLELPEVVRVPGELLRRAILEGVGASERRRLHGRVVAVLEREGAGKDPERIEVLAHHAARAVDRRRAPDYLCEAADVALRAGRAEVAARRLVEAALITRDDEDAQRAVELALRAAEVALVAGNPALAERVLSDVGSGVGVDDPPTVVRMALARARAAGRRDAWMDAVFSLAEVSDVIDALDDRALAARARLEWARAELEAGRPADAVARLGRAVDEAERAAAHAVHGRALCALATGFAWLGRPSDADRAASAALAVAARVGEGELRHLALAAMAEASAGCGALAEAAARFEEAAEVARETGPSEIGARLDALASAYFVEAGEEARAVPLAERAASQARRAKVEPAAQLGAAVQAALAVATHPDASWVGRAARAVERLDEMARYGDAALAAAMLARVHAALGDAEGAAGARARGVELARAAGCVPLARLLGEGAGAAAAP